LLAGTLAVLLALADHRLDSASAHGLLLGARVALLLIGVLATGVAIACQARSAVVLGLAALVAFTASHALDPEWDTIYVLFRIATVVALAAGVIVLLPQTGRRAAVSLMVLFHFGGILTAVANVPPPGGDAPWLVSQLWSRVYRPYLQFMYLTNAYHFYAPDPGPPCFLWFHVEYDDGSARWVKLPDREKDAKDPFALQFYRRLPITESTNQLLPPMPAPDDVLRRRLTASARDGIPTPAEINQVMPTVFQYRVPSDYSKRLLPAYARHAAQAFSHQDGRTQVSGVKVYRVVHIILAPADFAAGASVVDPTLYWPYFQGEFDRDGNLKDWQDPYLYWLIPIMKAAAVQTPLPGDLTFDPRSVEKPRTEILDYVAVHASIRR
jgi:hypothetical protein